MIKYIPLYFLKNNYIDQEEVDTFEYGLKLFLLKISHIFLMLIVGALFNTFISTVLFIGNFMYLRGKYGGAHSKYIMHCYVVSVVMCLVNIILSNLIVGKLFISMLYIIFNILIYKLSTIKSNYHFYMTIVGCLFILLFDKVQSAFALSSFFSLLLIIIMRLETLDN